MCRTVSVCRMHCPTPALNLAKPAFYRGYRVSQCSQEHRARMKVLCGFLSEQILIAAAGKPYSEIQVMRPAAGKVKLL